MRDNSQLFIFRLSEAVSTAIYVCEKI